MYQVPSGTNTDLQRSIMPAFGTGGYCDLAKSRRYYAIFIRWASYKFVGCIRDRGYSVQFGIGI